MRWKETCYKQNLLEGLFYDNASILKFWHLVTFLSYHSSWEDSTPPTPWPSLIRPTSSIFKIFVSPPLFSVPPLLRYFKQFSLPSRNPLLPQSDQPTFLGLNKHQKGDFTSSTVAFYQKSVFNILNLVINRLS